MPEVERVQQNTPTTLSQQWYEDGSAVDPGTVTVGITRADGTVLVAPGQATGGATTNPRTFNLTTSHTATLDTLRVTWTSTLKGTLVSFVEVTGGFLFTIAEARALKPLDNTTLYTTAAIVAMRTRVEEALEDACGVAFVPRYTQETVTGDGTMTLFLKWPKVRDIRSASATYQGSTTTLSASDLTNLAFTQHGTLYGYTWTQGYPWTVGYEHGHDRPPERVRRAALMLARSWLVQGPIDDRAATFNAGADGGTYSLVVPGRNGSIFGLPEVDTVVQEYGLRVGVA